jgi:hypothetical protein
MKLNQVTAAAFLCATFASSSLAASVSSHEELKDKIAPLLSSNHNYLHRMLQELTDQCSADIEAPLPTFVNAIEECALAQSDMVIEVGATATVTVDTNYRACDSSLFKEACTADRGMLDRRYSLSWTCTNLS